MCEANNWTILVCPPGGLGLGHDDSEDKENKMASANTFYAKEENEIFEVMMYGILGVRTSFG